MKTVSIHAFVLFFSAMAMGQVLTWDGSGDQTWSQPDTTSWSGGNYDNGTNVQFLGAGAGPVTIQAAGVTPGNILVNSSPDYTFSGGSIGGSGTLTKAGSSDLILSGANTFSGGVVIQKGEVSLSGSSALPSTADITFSGTANLEIPGGSGIVLSGLVISNGVTASIGRRNNNNTVPVTFNGVVSGSGTLGVGLGHCCGSGRHFLLNTANTFTGPIRFQDGRFNDLHVASLADGGDITAVSGTLPSTFHLHSSAIAELIFDVRRFVISGSPGLGINNNSTYPITINTDLEVTTAGAATLTLSSVAGPTNAFMGNIADSTGGGVVSVTKTGAGIWTLSGVNTYSGETTVSGGTLVLEGRQSLLDEGTLNIITGGKVEIASSREAIAQLKLDGATQTNDTWGSTLSSANNKDDDYFIGSGVLYVGVPLPPSGTIITLY